MQREEVVIMTGSKEKLTEFRRFKFAEGVDNTAVMLGRVHQWINR